MRRSSWHFRRQNHRGQNLLYTPPYWPFTRLAGFVYGKVVGTGRNPSLGGDDRGRIAECYEQMELDLVVLD
jgi:hypothetical protein